MYSKGTKLNVGFLDSFARSGGNKVMRWFVAFSLWGALSACADNPAKPTQQTARQMLSEKCAAGYVLTEAGACEPQSDDARVRPTHTRTTK